VLRTTNSTPSSSGITLVRTTMEVRGIRFDSTRSNYSCGVRAVFSSELYYRDCIFGYGMTDHLYAEGSSRLTPRGNYTIEGNANAHAALATGSVFRPGSDPVTIDNLVTSQDTNYMLNLSTNSVAYLPDNIGWTRVSNRRRARITSGATIIQRSTSGGGGTGLFQLPGALGVEILSGGTVVLDYDT
jgi:hypothetical protein